MPGSGLRGTRVHRAMVKADKLPDACSKHSPTYDEKCEACRLAARAKALAKMVDVYVLLFATQSEVVDALVGDSRAVALVKMLQVRKMLAVLDRALADVKATLGPDD